MRAKPGRVMKGKRLPGHMGHENVTMKNKDVVVVAADKHVIGIKGPIPGAINGTVFIKF